MNGKIGKILASAVGLLIIVYLLYQTVFASYSSVKTETVIQYTAEEIIKSEGYIIREETLITSPDASDGVLSYAISDGSRVAKGGKVAGIYKSEREVEIKAQIAALDKQIENLSAVCSMDMSNVTDMNQLNLNIGTSLNGLLDSVEDGDYSELAANSDNYLTLLNKRLVALGKSTDFSSRLENLKSQRNDLSSQLGTDIAVISDNAGYFVSTVDGYENVLTVDSIDTLTKKQLEDAKPQTIDMTNVIGKTVNSIDWYIATSMSFEESLKFAEEQSLTVRLPLSTATEVPVTVSKINRDISSNEAVVVFGCRYMSSELSLIRNQPITIVLNSNNGLYVPNDALHISDDKKGVYVKIGNTIKFKPVEVIYTGNGFVVCKNTTDGLRLYDEIVIKGKDLYDGKVVE